MHVNKSKKLAVSGLLAAFAAVMMVLSSTIESSTLFLIAAASFTVGITIREWGMRYGAGYFVASNFVNLIIAPNKFYCITYAAMGIYILLIELLWEKIAENRYISWRRTVFWLGKYLVFNAMYVPAVLFLRDYLFTGRARTLGIAVVLLVGQVALFVFDNAYRYFQSFIWGRIRIKLIG